MISIDTTSQATDGATLSAKSRWEALFEYLFLLFVFLIPLSDFLSVRILVLTAIARFTVTTKASWTGFVYQTWDAFLYLGVLVLGLMYSSDYRMGLKELETSFSFFAIPFVVSRFSNSNFLSPKRIFLAFTAGLVLSCILSLSTAIVSYLETEKLGQLFYYNLTNKIGLHPTYLAYYLIFAISVWLYIYFVDEPGARQVTILFVITFLFLILLLTGGQTAFVSLLFVFAFFILKKMVEPESLPRWGGVVLIIAMIICMFTINATEFRSEYMNLSDSWERFVLWESALKATAPNLFFGVGTGDYKEVLNQYYLTHSLPGFANGSYNSHNQFIHTLFTNGILGIAALLVLISRPIFLAVKHHQILGVLIFFPFLIYGTTEVFLGRYQGVVFFVLLHQVFLYHCSLFLRHPVR